MTPARVRTLRLPRHKYFIRPYNSGVNYNKPSRVFFTRGHRHIICQGVREREREKERVGGMRELDGKVRLSSVFCPAITLTPGDPPLSPPLPPGLAGHHARHTRTAPRLFLTTTTIHTLLPNIMRKTKHNILFF